MKFLVCLFALATLAQATVLKCEFRSNYACYIQHQTVAEGDEVTFDTTGHYEGKTDSDVGKVFFEGGSLAFVPSNLFEIFPNLEFLSFENVELKQFKREYLKGAHKLNELVIFNVPIDHFDDDSFEEIQQLEDLQIGKTKITTFSPDLFRFFTNLKNLDFTENNFSAGLPSDAFDYLSETLVRVNLNRNKLSYLQGGLFSDFVKLDTLYLNVNDFKKLDGSRFLPIIGGAVDVHVDSDVEFINPGVHNIST